MSVNSFLKKRGWSRIQRALLLDVFLLICGFLNLSLLFDFKLSIHPLLAIMLVLMGVYARRLLGELAGLCKRWRKRRSKRPNYGNDWRALPYVIFSGLFFEYCINGLLEELAFRGTVLGILMSYLPVAKAVLLQAAIFALWHIVVVTHDMVEVYNFKRDLYQKVYLDTVIGHFWAGIVYAAVFLLSGSIWVGWLTHLLSNTIGRMNRARYRAIVVFTEYEKDGPKDPRKVDPGAICSIILENKQQTFWLTEISTTNGEFTMKKTRNPHDEDILEVPFQEAYRLAQVIQKKLPYKIPLLVE